tara:strand:- start:455 stop:709 length:255 start_codon:yes stop_codon:yes gene_type:complete
MDGIVTGEDVTFSEKYVPCSIMEFKLGVWLDFFGPKHLSDLNPSIIKNRIFGFMFITIIFLISNYLLIKRSSILKNMKEINKNI